MTTNLAELTSHPDPATMDAEGRRARRSARRERRRRSRSVVFVIAVASALVATQAAGEPTGVELVDAAYRAAFGALVVLGTAWSKRWTWFLLAGVAGAVGASELTPLLLGLTAMGLAFGSLAWNRRQRELGALVGAFAVQSLLRLPTDLAFAVPTAAAVLAPLPAFLSASQNVRRARRHRIAILVLGAVLTVVGGAFVVGMLDIESNARHGVQAARRGIAAARSGDDAAAASWFQQAEAELAAARTTSGAWWLAPARVVPVLAQHVGAVDDVAREGQALAALSADQVATLAVEGLSDPAGGLDLRRIDQLAPRAASVADALARARATVDDARSPWLVPPAADRLEEFAAEVAAVAPSARLAAEALALAPDLLGADGPRAYIVLIGNPAEARELGGFVSAVGVLRADGGQLTFETAGAVSAANDVLVESGLQVTAALPVPLPASDPESLIQNWTNTVHLPAVTTVAAELGPALARQRVDGVLYVDPYAIAALMKITGPVRIDGLAQPLRAEDASDFLLREQYLLDAFDGAGQRKDLLRDTAEAVFARLTAGPLPDPRRFADTLGPSVRARRLLFSTVDDAAHHLLRRTGLRPTTDQSTTDQLLLAQENLRANKLDAYLTRSMRYDVEIDAEGTVSAIARVELTNTATDDLPAYVTGDRDALEPGTLPETTNRMGLDLYTTLEPVDVLIDGERTGFGVAPVHGLNRVNTVVEVGSGQTVVVEFRLSGEIDPADYALTVVPNAAAATDTFSARVDLDGARVIVEPRAVDEPIQIVRS